MSGYSLIDVIGGILGGVAIGLVIPYFWRKLRKHFSESGGVVVPRPSHPSGNLWIPVIPPNAPECEVCGWPAVRKPSWDGRCPTCGARLRFPNRHRRECFCGFEYLAPNMWTPHRCPQCTGWQPPYDGNGEPLARPHQPPPPPPPSVRGPRGRNWTLHCLADGFEAIDWLERFYAGEPPDGLIWTERPGAPWRPFYRRPS